MIQMNVNFESIEKAWGKPKKNVLDELEEWLKKICEQEFVFEDGYDYCTERAYGCKVCLDKIQELKKGDEINDKERNLSKNKKNK